MTVDSLPAIVNSQGSFFDYLQKIKDFPILTLEEERDCAIRIKEDGDVKAAQILITSHLRLVVKIAVSFRYYGLPMVDLISEGNIGLMKAVQKFDYHKGFRLSTYAMWWIKASIQEYILHSWSLVRMGTTTAQKRLFFSLNKEKERIRVVDGNNLSSEELKRIANNLQVSKDEVLNMNQRIQNPDGFLNDVITNNKNDDGIEAINLLEAPESSSPEDWVMDSQEESNRLELVKDAFEELNDREKYILQSRKMSDEPAKLEDLSKVYNISCERVRQIENRAIEKLRSKVSNHK